MAAATAILETIIESNTGFENVCIDSELAAMANYDDYSLWLDEMEAKEAWWNSIEQAACGR